MPIIEVNGNSNAPPVFIPGPTNTDIEEAKLIDAAWAAYDAEARDARTEFNKQLEQARETKRKTGEAAYRTLRDRLSKAMERVHEAQKRAGEL